jgi:type I restriction enzyme M protein
MAKNYAKGLDQDQLSLLPKLPKPKETEVEAYAFIRHQLRDLGWIVKDPSKGGSGQVWTQNQCLADPHMKAAFGQVRPENVVKLSEKFVWVIEAKATRKELDKALAEATNFYCEKINGIKGQYKALMATGVAGNEDAGYLMRTAIHLDGKWHTVTINKQEATGLL